MPASAGVRFCIHHPPARHAGSGVAIVFAPAFAEEMNKSRHVVAQTARRLSEMGIGVLLIDLLGCGDSSGSFDEATWTTWRDDIELGSQWLRQRGYRRLIVGGMRLGALLAAECAAEAPGRYERCVLWQPVLSGETHLMQFLRLRTAGAMIVGAKAGETLKQLRSRLIDGEALEVAGYRLTPHLARDIESRTLVAVLPVCPVQWFEVVADPTSDLSPASARVIEAWQCPDGVVDLRRVAGEPFWSAASAAELTQCPTLVDATAQAAAGWL